MTLGSPIRHFSFKDSCYESLGTLGAIKSIGSKVKVSSAPKADSVSLFLSKDTLGIYGFDGLDNVSKSWGLCGKFYNIVAQFKDDFVSMSTFFTE